MFRGLRTPIAPTSPILRSNRKRFNTSLAEGQAKLTMTAIVMKVVAGALRRHAMLNCSFDAENDEIIYKEHVHLGIAVDTPRGLVVPVIRNIDRKPLPQLSRRTRLTWPSAHGRRSSTSPSCAGRRLRSRTSVPWAGSSSRRW